MKLATLPPFTLCLSLVALPACARKDRAAEPATAAPAETAAPATPPGPPAPPPPVILPHDAVLHYSIFNGMTGQGMTLDQVMQAFNEANVVLIGELHDHPVGRELTRRMWEQASNQNPSAALAFEFLERDQQTAVDDYLAGIVDEKTMRDIGRISAGSFPPPFQDMLDRAKTNGQPVVAANIPRRYAREARLKGYDVFKTYTPEQARFVVIPESIPDNRYWTDFQAMLPHQDANPAPGMSIAEFFRAQWIKDVTMADSVLRLARQPRKPVVLIVGAFHTDFTGGTAMRLASLDPNLFTFTISFVDAYSDTLRSEDQYRADAVIYVGEPSAYDEPAKP